MTCLNLKSIKMHRNRQSGSKNKTGKCRHTDMVAQTNEETTTQRARQGTDAKIQR